MNITLRVFLVASAIAVLYFVVRKIKKSKFEASDSIFWLFFIAILVILGAFPQISYGLSNILGFESPSNFIFLCVIAILLIRVFSLTAKVSLMRAKLDSLVQEVALDRNERAKHTGSDGDA